MVECWDEGEGFREPAGSGLRMPLGGLARLMCMRNEVMVYQDPIANRSRNYDKTKTAFALGSAQVTFNAHSHV